MLSPTGSSIMHEKSVGLGIFLVVICGPFAFFYLGAGIAFGAIGISIVAAVLAVFTFGLPFLILWPALIVTMINQIRDFNESVRRHNAALQATRTPSTGVPERASRVSVRIVGAVHKPGTYQLPFGASVADAIRAAGGADAIANLEGLGLERAALDGEWISVPSRE